MRERDFYWLLNYVILNSVTLSPTVQSLIIYLQNYCFLLDFEIYHLQMEVSGNR